MPRAGYFGVRERNVRAHLKARLKVLGGHLRKVNWVNRRSAPDELVLLPEDGVGFFAELKRPGKVPTELQAKEIILLRKCGFRVEILDSAEAVDRALFWNLR